MSDDAAKHVVVVLYAGNFLEATRRRTAGLADQYRHHSYALTALSRVRRSGSRVTVIQRQSEAEYDENEGGIRFIGLGRANEGDSSAMIGRYLQAQRVSHVMVCFPSEVLLSTVLLAPVRVSAVLADSFPARYRNFLRYRRLGRLLRAPQVDFVANHHLNSSRQLADVLRIPAERVVPWDWPLDLVALARSSAKSRPATGDLRLCYAGMISEAKGVWDLVEAVRMLRSQGEPAFLELAGEGDTQAMWSLVDRHRLRPYVDHLGRVGGDQVLAMMRRSSFVCVPSHHGYPEGLPLTIFEAMASGTPLVASDHPMFRGVVRDGSNGFVFQAGKPGRLASTVRRAWNDVAAYEGVSRRAAAEYPTLGLSALWGDVLERWVRGAPEDVVYLAENSLATRGSARHVRGDPA